VPKNRFRPSAGRSAGTEDQCPRCFPPPLNRRPLENAGCSVSSAASSNCRFWFGWTRTRWPLGDRSGLPYRRQRHFALNAALCLLPCPLHVLAPALSALSRGRAPHLSQLVSFSGSTTPPTCRADVLHAPAVEDAVDHDRQPLDGGLASSSRGGRKKMIGRAPSSANFRSISHTSFLRFWVSASMDCRSISVSTSGLQ